MRILGIETSCDETAAAVVENGEKVLSNVVSSSLKFHSKTGGVVPEVAAREQVKGILPVVEEALREAGVMTEKNVVLANKGTYRLVHPEGRPESVPSTDSGQAGMTRVWEGITPDIDTIAVTYGPGLIGSLLVGVETAKTLAYVWNKPLIAVNHMHGHIYANWLGAPSMSSLHLQCKRKRGSTDSIETNLEILGQAKNDINEDIPFPALALVVSGGHTDLLLMKSHGEFEVIGGTRDDAAGECFDKVGRLLGLPYPAGSTIAKLAETGDPKAFKLPRPMIGSRDFDFSFSGLKTAVLNLVKNNVILANEVRPGSVLVTDSGQSQNDKKEQVINDLCASVQQAIVDVLVRKTIRAAEEYQVKSILLGGGVGANELLRNELRVKSEDLRVDLHIPSANLCTDNGAMIAAAAFYMQNRLSWKDLTIDPQLYY